MFFRIPIFIGMITLMIYGIAFIISDFPELMRLLREEEEEGR